MNIKEKIAFTSHCVAYLRNQIHKSICRDAKTHQAVVESEYPDVPAVVYVITPHDRIGVVLHPDPSQSVPGDFVVFISALSIVCHV